MVLAFGYGMIRSYLGNRKVREQLLHSALEGQCLGPESWDASLWMSVPIRKGTDILVIAALDVYELEKERGPDSDVRRAFSDACSMLWLQYSMSKNAEELERSLRLASSGYPVDPRAPGADTEVTMAVGPLQKNLEAFLPALQVLKEQKALFHTR